MKSALITLAFVAASATASAAWFGGGSNNNPDGRTFKTEQQAQAACSAVAGKRDYDVVKSYDYVDGTWQVQGYTCLLRNGNSR